MISRTVLLLGVTAVASLFGISHAVSSDRSEPSDALFRAAADLSLEALEPLPSDASNRWADDERAADLGHQLFFDTRLSANGRISCASCHGPKRQFQDSLPLAQGVGTTSRRTMPIAASAYSPFLFWDGRKDSQWAQALGPLESAVEHGGT